MNYNDKDDDSDELWDDSPASQESISDRPVRSDPTDRSDWSDEPAESDWSADYKDSEDDAVSEDDVASQDDVVSRPPKPQKKRRFFGLGFGSSEEKHKDYFNEEDEDEEDESPAPHPKTPRLDPEDPDYWVGEESEIPDIMPRPRKVWRWWLAGIIVMIGLLVWSWLWMFQPYVEEAVQYGYVENIQREGTAMKTFEGVMIPYKEIHDTTRVYREDFRFSVASDSTAARLKGMMLGCIPVRVEYKKYHMSLPWRGNETVVVVRADTANPNLILPPEFR